jgi:hypothetical protein
MIFLRQPYTPERGWRRETSSDNPPGKCYLSSIALTRLAIVAQQGVGAPVSFFRMPDFQSFLCAPEGRVVKNHQTVKAEIAIVRMNPLV